MGWKEYVDLREWGVFGIRAKIDTGAKSSSLHVEEITPLPNRRNPDQRIAVETDVKRIGRVRSSTGHFTRRYFVETVLCLGGVERRIEINLVDRQQMIHRMLIGRTALCNAFLVDVSRAYTTPRDDGPLAGDGVRKRRRSVDGG